MYLKPIYTLYYIRLFIRQILYGDTSALPIANQVRLLPVTCRLDVIFGPFLICKQALASMRLEYQGLLDFETGRRIYTLSTVVDHSL